MAAVRNIALDDWKARCWCEQENLSNNLCDRIWDRFLYPKEDIYIFRKIAIAQFGMPYEESDNLGLKDEQIALINKIKDICIKYNVDKQEICLAVIFVFVYMNEKTQTMVPLIRVMAHRETSWEKIPQNVFVDHVGRVYKTWAKYVKRNTWNKCWLCVPRNGYYTPDLDVDFLDQTSRGKMLERIDKVSMVTNIGTSVGMLAGMAMCLFPPTAPIGAVTVTSCAVAGAPGAAYGVGRSVGRLADRAKHKQSIGLSDSESRQCWLTTATSLISIGTMGSTKFLSSTVQAGNLVSSTTRAVCTALNVTSVSISGLGVINSFYELSKKKDVTRLDIFQLTTSIFFFTHSVCNFKTASAIIKQAQAEQIAEMSKDLTPEQKRVRDALLQKERENIEGNTREIHGNAKFIKDMIKFDDIRDFLSQFKVGSDGKPYKNSFSLDPRSYFTIGEGTSKSLMEFSRRVRNGEITLQQFKEKAAVVLKHSARITRNLEQRVSQAILRRKYSVSQDTDDANVLQTDQSRNVDDQSQDVPDLYNSSQGTYPLAERSLFNNLSGEEYFHIAIEMGGSPVSGCCDMKWTQQGWSLECSFRSQSYGNITVKFDNLCDGVSVLAILQIQGCVIQRRYYMAW